MKEAEDPLGREDFDDSKSTMQDGDYNRNIWNFRRKHLKMRRLKCYNKYYKFLLYLTRKIKTIKT